MVVGAVGDAVTALVGRHGRPLRAADMTDRFRRGMLTLGAATRRAGREWLRATIAELTTDTDG